MSCEICNYTTSDKSNLLKHLKTKSHLAKVNNSYININNFSCDVCNYTTTIKCNYNKHMASITHLNKINNVVKETKMFSCSICSYCSPYSSNLSKHLKIHYQTNENKRRIEISKLKGTLNRLYRELEYLSLDINDDNDIFNKIKSAYEKLTYINNITIDTSFDIINNKKESQKTNIINTFDDNTRYHQTNDLLTQADVDKWDYTNKNINYHCEFIQKAYNLLLAKENKDIYELTSYVPSDKQHYEDYEYVYIVYGCFETLCYDFGLINCDDSLQDLIRQ